MEYTSRPDRACSIARLPTELLVATFKLQIEPVDTRVLPWLNPRGQRHGPETVASVCRRWRQIALDIPYIWSHLYISDAWSTEKLKSYWQQMRIRYAGCALNVTVIDVNVPIIEEELPLSFVSTLNTVTRLAHLRIVMADTKAAAWVYTLFQHLTVKPTSFTVQTPFFPCNQMDQVASCSSTVRFWGGLLVPLDQVFTSSCMSQLTDLTLDGVVSMINCAPQTYPLPQMEALRRIRIKQPQEHEMAPFIIEDLFSLPKLEELHLHAAFSDNWTITEGNPATPDAPLRSLYISQYFPIKFMFEKYPPVLPKLVSFGVEEVEKKDLLAFLSANPTILNFSLPSNISLRAADWKTTQFDSLDVPQALNISPLLRKPFIFSNLALLRLTYNPIHASKYIKLIEKRCRAQGPGRIPLLVIEVGLDEVNSARDVLCQLGEGERDVWKREDGLLWYFFNE